MKDRFTMTIGELADTQTQRFGPDSMDWAFICPKCGDIATVGDFYAKGQADLAGTCCIGRVLGALSPGYTGRGCDWAAFGLIPGPWHYVRNDGKAVPGFEIAPPPAS